MPQAMMDGVSIGLVTGCKLNGLLPSKVWTVHGRSYMLMWLLSIPADPTSNRKRFYSIMTTKLLSISGRKAPQTMALQTMSLVHLLYFCAAHHNLNACIVHLPDACIVHLPDACNNIVNFLSCFQMTRFRKLSPQAPHHTRSLLGQCTASYTPLAMPLSWCSSLN